MIPVPWKRAASSLSKRPTSWCACSHPNLPRVAAYFEEQGRVYLVMEFVQGESLEKRLEQANAPLLEGQVVDWAIQVCEVLAYLHEQPTPIIFRDMKPSNVMVTPQDRIKLIDFGIARTYKVGKRKDTVTMGSENYAAPEQWGKSQTDARADIYGLGATMYHLLTNVPPLPAFVPTPRVPIQQYNPAVTAATVAVVEKAMAENRDKRFASAREMQSALLDCLSRPERRRVEAVLQQVRAPSAPTYPAQAAPAPLPAFAARPATGVEHAHAPAGVSSAYPGARGDPTAPHHPGAARAAPRQDMPPLQHLEPPRRAFLSALRLCFRAALATGLGRGAAHQSTLGIPPAQDDRAHRATGRTGAGGF